MSKKVSELIKELDITLQELKDYTSKMGIIINSAKDSVEDFDANRIVSTINLMKGNSSGAKSGSNKPKIKATPVINKDAVKSRPNMGKPVIPKKPVAPETTGTKETAPEEQPAKAEEKQPEVEVTKKAAEEAPEKKAVPAEEAVKAPEVKEQPKAEKAEEPKTEPKEQPEEKPEKAPSEKPEKAPQIGRAHV